MNGVNVPFLPVGLWLMAVTLTVAVLLLTFMFYVYQRHRQAALIADSKDVADLAANKQLLLADVEALRAWIENQKMELDRITAEREDQERLRAELAGFENQVAARDQENQTLRNEVGELENQRHLLNTTLENLRRDIGDLEGMRGEAQVLKQDLADLERKRQDAQSVIQSAAETQVRLEALNAERINLERVVEKCTMDVQQAGQAAEIAHQQAAQARSHADEEAQQLQDMRHEWARLDALVNSLRFEQRALEDHIGDMQSKIPQLEEKIQIANREMEEHASATAQARNEAAEVNRLLTELNRERDKTEDKVTELVVRKTSLEQEITRLEGRLTPTSGHDEDPLAPYADLLEVAPVCLSDDQFPEGMLRGFDEEQALLEFQDSLRNQGLLFSMRVINAFHTALKCHTINPLTVLAGVSGTGKTLLPLKYAQHMGMHSLILSVQPGWDSPQDMFGFYNYLEKNYKATDLSRALIRMDPYNYNTDQFPMLKEKKSKCVLLVLLDEMNLARTEYYFSEFLSKLEVRRLVRNPEEEADRERAEVVLDTGPAQRGRLRIWVGENVLFVGTMNEDETTQTLSDKVIDRANVLRFGKPPTGAWTGMEQGSALQDRPRQCLMFEQWRQTMKPYERREPWTNHIEQWVTRLNDALEKMGRPFGYRIHEAIGHYVANYPGVVSGDTFRKAFADQVEQKIIPKLRGIDLNQQHAEIGLDEIARVVQELNDPPLADAFEGAREEKTIGMFLWRGVTRPVEDG